MTGTAGVPTADQAERRPSKGQSALGERHFQGTSAAKRIRAHRGLGPPPDAQGAAQHRERHGP